MDAWVRFSAQSQARERLCRAAQYACSLLGHALQKHGASPELQKQIRQLEGHLSQVLLLARVLRGHPPLLLDVVRNACDLFIPLDKLGLWRCGPGIVGLCGLVSSILSILLG